jgi:hypothetical protein
MKANSELLLCTEEMRYEANHLPSGPNPTIVSYNACVEKNYNATGSLVRFATKNIFFYFYEKPSILQQRWRCSCKFRSRRIGSRLWVI